MAAAVPAGEQPQALVETGRQLGQRQRPQPHRGQLDRQRQPVEPLAEPDDVRQVPRGKGEPGDRGRGALDKQLDRGARVDPAGRLVRAQRVIRIGRPGNRERVERAGVLAADVERLAAGGQQGDLRRAGDQGLGQHRAGVDQVLAAVEDKQQPAAAELVEQLLSPGAWPGPWQPERAGDRVRHQPRVAHPGQLDQAGTVGEAWLRPGRRPQRQPGLADAGRPGHGDQPGARQQLVQPGKLRLPADKRGGLHRQPQPLCLPRRALCLPRRLPRRTRDLRPLRGRPCLLRRRA